ncbi:MAG: PH domain-containing protein [Methanobacteriaceae archaeon]
MFKKRRVNSHPGERVIFKTKPRFLVHSTGVLLKGIAILLILYFFRIVLEWINNFRNNLDAFIQLPLVEWTTYALFIIILILLLWVAYDFLGWRQKQYTLTNHRIIVQSGILRRRKSFIHYDKIQDIVVVQSVVDRLFRAGDMEIFGGHEGTTLILEDVPNPLEVENVINRLMEDEEFAFSPPEKPKAPRSIIEEYDKKFKR